MKPAFFRPPTAATLAFNAALSLLTLGVLPGTCQAQSWGGTSNALALGLPALAAYHVYQAHDREGAPQLAYTLASTLGATLALKSQIHAMRPNQKGDDSMPSGHTAMAFAAARFMHERYGSNVHPGLLYGAASLTAWARVRAHQHHWRDVVAGAALGISLGSCFTEPLKESVTTSRLDIRPETKGLHVTWQQTW